MGYSISIKFKNEGQKGNALHFIKENKEMINQMAALKFLGNINLPYFNVEEYSEDENIPYGPKGKNLIGWKERGISNGLYTFVLWMSHKCGQKFYYYDNKRFKVFEMEKYDNTIMEAQVNSKGFLFKEEILHEGLFQRMIEYLAGEEKQYNKLIEILTILENNWNENLKLQDKKKIKP